MVFRIPSEKPGENSANTSRRSRSSGRKLDRSARKNQENVVKARATTRGAGTDEQGRSRAFGAALWNKAMGRSAQTDRDMTPQQSAQSLLDKHGGNKSAAAREAGMHPRSFGRALDGRNVRAKNAEKIGRAERASKVSDYVTTRLGRAMTGRDRSQDSSSRSNTLGLWCRVRISSSVEDRWIYPGGHSDNEGALDDLRDLIVTDGPDAVHDRAQEIMETYMSDTHQEMDVLEVMDIQY